MPKTRATLPVVPADSNSVAAHASIGAPLIVGHWIIDLSAVLMTAVW